MGRLLYLYLLDFYGLKDAQFIVIDMILDDGNQSKSNRNNLFNASFSQFGAGISFHTQKELICYIFLRQSE